MSDSDANPLDLAAPAPPTENYAQNPSSPDTSSQDLSNEDGDHHRRGEGVEGGTEE
ncbi:hypothetical protein CALCODRAFT_492175 [Calocera cornea HHB12733]|uniref:Uncharacterized protein n=1 Tax=Calocera cornea HHB12733 TaxID=1353952 RepID=A0A165IJ48_9BASI|nr:hypothetical protein CALCODRAFT_492175 [Calocera cornea HHB12733]